MIKNPKEKKIIMFLMKKYLLDCFYFFQLYKFFRIASRTRISILMYHGFTEKKYNDGIENNNGKHIYIKLFRAQIKYIKENYNVISLEQYVQSCNTGKRLPDNSIIITIDDGYKSNYTLAYPVIKEFDIPATIFLTTDFIDNKNFLWVDRLEYAINKTDQNELPFLMDGKEYNFSLKDKRDKILCNEFIKKELKKTQNESIEKNVDRIEVEMRIKLSESQRIPEIYNPLEWTEIQEMVQNSKIDFGSHTHKHLILSRYDKKVIQQELVLSKNIIEKKTGINTELFCYPNGALGDFNLETGKLVREAGYTCALTTASGTNSKVSNLYELKRFAVSNTDLKSFILSVCGVRHFLSKLRGTLFLKNCKFI
jgi:peptidoglycan/xylan/chitin deacetylase (PgdA/CDA1 family)